MSTDENFWIFSFDRYWTSAVLSGITIANCGHFHYEKCPNLPTGRGKKGKKNCRIEACSLAGQPLAWFCSVLGDSPCCASVLRVGNMTPHFMLTESLWRVMLRNWGTGAISLLI